MNDGRELLGHATSSGAIATLGHNRANPQLALLVSTAIAWRPMDEQLLEEFERG